MGQKGLARLAVLLAVALLPLAAAAQSGDQAGAHRQNPPFAASSAAVPRPAVHRQNPPSAAVAKPAASPAPDEGAFEQPRVTVVNPPPQPAPWTLRDKIAWAANLVLVLLGYAGILLAVSTLKKIERQTGYAEAAAEAASASAQAALLNAQAVIHAERPWILISAEPSPGRENSFTVLATNRGRTPAKIIASAEQTRIVLDEKHLPAAPEYENEEPGALLVPIILVPGESAAIKPFCREDVKGLCESEERFKRIERWEEKVYLYGKVSYVNLIAPDGDPAHETNWCCWYIHGQKNSGMVLAGPPAYNSHT